MGSLIRPATKADIPILVEIIRKAFFDVAVRFELTEENCSKHPSNCKAQWIEEALAKGVRYYILESEGVSCGCVALEQAGPEVCYLERLAVIPAQQRRGYGRALVDHVIAEASVLGSHQVDIGIIADQAELKDWYKEIGFVEQKTATFPHLPFEVLFMSVMRGWPMNHIIEIHAAKELSSERSLELVRWFDQEFGKIPFQWTDPDWYVLALSDSKLIGRVGIVERKVSVNGGLLEIAGISGVVTDIERRGSGIATDMLRSATDFVHDRLKINYCLLLCRSEVAPFYAKLGWKIIDGPTTFDQPSGKAVFPRLTMIHELGEKPWPKGPVDLCGLPW